MADQTKPSVDTTLEANQMVLEAHEVSTTECAGVVNDSNSLECIAKNFEQYIQNYQETWQAAWASTVSEYEQNVESWQTAVSQAQAKAQTTSQTQPLQSSQSSQAPAKSKPKSSASPKANSMPSTPTTPSKPEPDENG